MLILSASVLQNCQRQFRISTSLLHCPSSFCIFMVVLDLDFSSGGTSPENRWRPLPHSSHEDELQFAILNYPAPLLNGKGHVTSQTFQSMGRCLYPMETLPRPDRGSLASGVEDSAIRWKQPLRDQNTGLQADEKPVTLLSR